MEIAVVDQAAGFVNDDEGEDDPGDGTLDEGDWVSMHAFGGGAEASLT